MHVRAFACRKRGQYGFEVSLLLWSDDRQQNPATSGLVQRHEVRGVGMGGEHHNNVSDAEEPIHPALEGSLRNGQRCCCRG